MCLSHCQWDNIHCRVSVNLHKAVGMEEIATGGIYKLLSKRSSAPCLQIDICDWYQLKPISRDTPWGGVSFKLLCKNLQWVEASEQSRLCKCLDMFLRMGKSIRDHLLSSAILRLSSLLHVLFQMAERLIIFFPCQRSVGWYSLKHTETFDLCQSPSFQSFSQAYFNLGYMHQLGRGVERDTALAKRNYDRAVEVQSEAIMPVKIALFFLDLQNWWVSQIL